MVRAAVHTDKCAPYADAASARRTPTSTECRAWLGPNQPGVTTPDPSGARPRRRAAAQEARAGPRPARAASATRPPLRAATRTPAPSAPAGGEPGAPAERAAAAARRPARRPARQAATAGQRPPSPSSTTCSAHDAPPEHLARREPGPGRRGDRARGRDRASSSPTTPTTACRSCRRSTCGCRAENAAALTKGSEVREGGVRIGVVKTIRTVRLPSGRAGAELAVTIQSSARRPAGGHLVHDPPALAARPEVPGDGARLLRPRGRRRATCSPRTRRRSRCRSTTSRGSSTTRRAAASGATSRASATRSPGRGPVAERASASCRGCSATWPRSRATCPTAARASAASSARAGRRPRAPWRRWPTPRPTCSPARRSPSRRSRPTPTRSRRRSRARTRRSRRASTRSRCSARSSPRAPRWRARCSRWPASCARRCPQINDAIETGIPVTRRSVRFYGDLKPTLVSLRELARDPATGIALRGLTANVTTLQPQLRFLGPLPDGLQLLELLLDLPRRAREPARAVRATRSGRRSRAPASRPTTPARWAPPSRPTARATRQASARRGAPVHLHGQSYTPAIGTERRGRLRERPARLHAPPRALQRPQVRDRQRPGDPGPAGPDLQGPPRVPRGQSFVRRPETGAQLER